MASLSARTVFLKLHPSARTFAERREVLRVMERFGEVSMFKSNKYSPRTPTPNTFIVLFASESAAQEAITASPIRYRLISNPSSNSTTTTSPAPSSTDPSPSPDLAPTSSTPSKPSEQTLSQQEAEEQEQPYQLHAYPSTHNHIHSLSSPLLNPLHGPYKPIPPKKSYIAASLAQNIPDSIMRPGLLDWETDGRVSRGAMDEFLSASSSSGTRLRGDNDRGEGEGEGEGEEERLSRADVERYGSGGTLGEGEKEGGREGKRAQFYHQQRQKKRAEKEIAGVMGGLRRLREEFLQKEKERELEDEWERGEGFAKVDVK